MGYVPICHTFSDDEDGFRNGKAFLESGDGGNNFRVFNQNEDILTFGIAVQGCPELNATCFPSLLSIAIACYLPRAACSSVTFN